MNNSNSGPIEFPLDYNQIAALVEAKQCVPMARPQAKATLLRVLDKLGVGDEYEAVVVVRRR